MTKRPMRRIAIAAAITSLLAPTPALAARSADGGIDQERLLATALGDSSCPARVPGPRGAGTTMSADGTQTPSSGPIIDYLTGCAAGF